MDEQEQDDEQNDKPEETGVPQKSGPETFHQELRHSQVTARVPETVGKGIFSTGSIVMQGPHEFVIDFLQSMAQPHRVAARVVLPPTVVPLFLAALQENLNKFQQHFGPPPKLPSPPPGATPPPISDIYEALKLPDEMLGGTYANAVMILHTASEFCFDFIMSAYPRSAVSSRIYLSAAQVPRFFESLSRAYDQYRKKLNQQRPPESSEE